jgi:hypothetical protein
VKRAVYDHAGQAETRGFNLLLLRACVELSSLFEEISHQILESSIASGRNSALENGTEARSLFHEQPQSAFCPANISGQNHYRQSKKSLVRESICQGRHPQMALANGK